MINASTTPRMDWYNAINLHTSKLMKYNELGHPLYADRDITIAMCSALWLFVKDIPAEDFVKSTVLGVGIDPDYYYSRHKFDKTITYPTMVEKLFITEDI